MANNDPPTLGCVLVLCVKLRLQHGSKFIPLPELLPPMLHNNFEIVRGSRSCSDNGGSGCDDSSVNCHKLSLCTILLCFPSK